MNELKTETPEISLDMDSAKPAGFWIRLLAYIIDLLIMLVVGLVALFTKEVWLVIVVSLIGMAYKPLMESGLGATAGKLALGLKVINDQGEKLSIVSAFVRSGIFILSSVPGTIISIKMKQEGIGSFDAEAVQAFNASNQVLQMSNIVLSILVVVSCLVVLFNAQKRALHDFIAESYVIYEKKGS